MHNPANSHGVSVPCPLFLHTLRLRPERLGPQGAELPTALLLSLWDGPLCHPQRQRVGCTIARVSLEAGELQRPSVILCRMHRSHGVQAAEVQGGVDNPQRTRKFRRSSAFGICEPGDFLSVCVEWGVGPETWLKRDRLNGCWGCFRSSFTVTVFLYNERGRRVS